VSPEYTVSPERLTLNTPSVPTSPSTPCIPNLA